MVDKVTAAEFQVESMPSLAARDLVGSTSGAGSRTSSSRSTNELAQELTDIILLLNARGSRAPVPSWLVGRLVTYRDYLATSTGDDIA
ncbi:MAG: hypothetical protein ACPHRO_02535 [Nannocystaceae bacterium]